MTRRGSFARATAVGLGLICAAACARQPVGSVAPAAAGHAATPEHRASTRRHTMTEPDNTDWLRTELARAPEGSTIRCRPGCIAGRSSSIGRCTSARRRCAPAGRRRPHPHRRNSCRRRDPRRLRHQRVRPGSRPRPRRRARDRRSAQSIVDNRIHDSLHGIYVRQADGAGSKATRSSGTQTMERRSDPFTTGQPGEGELCEVTLNQNRRGNGIHIWNSSNHQVLRNTIRYTRDGMYFSFVDRSQVRGERHRRRALRAALHVLGREPVRAERLPQQCRRRRADVVARHRPPRNRFLANRSQRSYGVLLQTVENSRLEENWIDGNTVGVFFESGHGNRLLGT